MSWTLKIDLVMPYYAFMSEEQFQKVEDAALDGKASVTFSEEEKRILNEKFTAHKNREAKIYRSAELNNKGISSEKGGQIEAAIRFYELNILEECVATHAYERLMILYGKEKRYKDELRVIDKAILVFSAENERLFKIAYYNSKNAEYQPAINAAFEKCESIKNKKGWYIFNPFPVKKYILRKEKLFAKGFLT